MSISQVITIRDVALRDGLQSWPVFISTEKKCEIIAAIRNAGVREIEITSFVSPKAVPQLRDAARLMQIVQKKEGCNYTALVLNLAGARRAIEAGAHKLMMVISATDAHSLMNTRRNMATSLSELNDIFSLATEKSVAVIGGVSVAFGCPYQGDVRADVALKIGRAYIDRGAESVIFADTTGMATPPRVSRLVESFKKQFPGQLLGLHLHNNRGTAMVNLYAALLAGADIFDTAIGGIGGCPNVPEAAGNLPTADVVYLLEDMGIDTGIDLNAIISAARLLQTILGRELSGQVMKSGPRALTTENEMCAIQ